MEALDLEGLNKMLDGFDDRTGEAVCTFAFCRGPGAEPIIFQGRNQVSQFDAVWSILNCNISHLLVQGTIVRPRGPPNFGK